MSQRMTVMRTCALLAATACLWACLPPSAQGRPALGYAAHQRAEILLRAEAEGPAALPVLAEALGDSSAMVRRTAAHALARMGEPAHEALHGALLHEDAEVRRIACAGLPPAWARDNRLADALSDPDTVARNWLRMHFARFAPQTPQEWEASKAQLARLMEHEDAKVRLHGVWLMSRWEEEPEQLAGLLENAATDADRDVRTMAQRALFPFDKPAAPAAARFPGQALELVSEQRLPKEGWRFKPEQPGRPGHRARWYASDFDDGEWGEIAIEQAWGEAGYEGFVGVGWYRRGVPVPAGEFDAAELHFSGVDESAWVWVNGQYAGQHDIGPSGWALAFSVDITDFVRWGEQNQITVRVMNTVAAGGIWRPAHLRIFRKAAQR